jgi:hypothetical protein
MDSWGAPRDSMSTDHNCLVWAPACQGLSITNGGLLLGGSCTPACLTFGLD